MASQGQPSSAPGQPQSGIDLQTLVLTALASAAAAYISSKLWASGTLLAAAMTPVVVALVREALQKPVDVVTAAVPRRGRSGRTTTTDVVRTPVEEATRVHETAPPPPLPPPAPGMEAGPVSVYTTRGRRLRWRLAVVTGLLGFLICVVVYTVPELIAGNSVSRDGTGTTLWGGKERKKDDNKGSTTTTTKTSTTATQTTETTPGQTSPATQTVTVPAPAETTPTTTTPAVPAETTPATTTPAPEGAAPEAPAP